MQLQDMTWPMVAQLPKSTPVVIPIAALEQHGHHMPVFTDSMLLGEVVRRTVAALDDRVLFTPLMWLGNSHHHMDFPGTMSASPRVYLDLLIDLAENMLTHGFQRILLLNGHGGNIVPAQHDLIDVLAQVVRMETLAEGTCRAGVEFHPVIPRREFVLLRRATTPGSE
ncbi:MAG: creatininase family protein, partial [Planctomycetaceae bacterium]